MLAHRLLILMDLKQSSEKAERLVARRSIYGSPCSIYTGAHR